MATPPPSFRGDWITPEHPEYPKAIARWAINAERRAAAVAFVKDAQDVSRVLKHAQDHGIPISIRGGGHSAAGASSVEDGIVIDLSRHLAGVRVDVEKKLAYVGGGALWESVDKAGIEHGLATVAGTVNHYKLLIIFRLTLGGGYGFLSGQHGLVLDNVVQATLVTADQKIRTINSEENPDLYWAIRGAGSNFGVVTEFVLQLHPQRRTVFAGMAIYPADALARMMAVITAWWDKGLDEREVVFQCLTKGPDGNPVIMLILFWNGSEEEGRAHFKEFFDLGPLVDHCSEIPYEALNAMQNQTFTHGRNGYMSGAFMTRPDLDLAVAALAQVNEIASKDVTAAILLEYIPTAKIMEVPKAATSHVRGDRISCVAVALWDEGGKERLPEMKAGVGKMVDLLLQSSDKDIPRAENSGYGNYIGEEMLPSVALEPRFTAPKVFGENYARLQELKKIYDPGMVFSRWCPIVPAV
ncbi:FAD-binding domain-containing protein [Infundibulicybe gibba]|nr:FAD-binding domain-containing protein [Infundibulicybe gibba]